MKDGERERERETERGRERAGDGKGEEIVALTKTFTVFFKLLKYIISV